MFDDHLDRCVSLPQKSHNHNEAQHVAVDTLERALDTFMQPLNMYLRYERKYYTRRKYVYLCRVNKMDYWV